MPQHPKKVFEESKSASDRIAIGIANFTGNMSFVWIHLLLFTLWILINLIARENAWDP